MFKKPKINNERSKIANNNHQEVPMTLGYPIVKEYKFLGVILTPGLIPNNHIKLL
jgi:hypothetical protein